MNSWWASARWRAPTPGWGVPISALLALIFIGFPAIAGFGFLVFLAALQNLSGEVKDAALIDGLQPLAPGLRH